MYRIVEAGRRNLAVLASQLLAQGVAVVAVGAGGGKYGGQLADIGPGMGGGFAADGERQLDDPAGPAAPAGGRMLGAGSTDGAGA